jgi:predicted kinase
MLAAYKRNHERAGTILKNGKAAIVAATYSRPTYHEMLRQLALEEDVPLTVFLLGRLDNDAISERLGKRKRQGDRSNITSMEGYNEAKNRYQAPTENVIMFDANQTLDQLVEVTLNTLDRSRNKSA